MERLTKRNSDGTVSQPTDLQWADALYRLAAYEDTGLTPERVKEMNEAYIEITERTYGPLHQKLGEWLQAEQDGRLVVLPCKEGDVLWSFYTWPWKKVYSFRVTKTSTLDDVSMIYTDKPAGVICASDFGKTVFLTREETEAALAAQEGCDKR